MKTIDSIYDIPRLIDRAWSLRFSQKIEETESVLREIERGLEISKASDGELRWQADLIDVSILRARGHFDRAESRVHEIGERIFARKASAPYQFYLQKALNRYSANDYSVSLEFFLLADSVAASVDDRLVCLMNVLTCLESLNLPWASTLEEIEKLLPEAEKSTLATQVRRQLEAFSLRGAFRAGRIEEVFSFPLEDEVSQAQYHRLWVSRLPYVALSLENEDKLLQKFTLSRSFHQRAYRLKTVLADPRLADGTGPADTPQKVDRVYLWTWNWLADPSERNRKSLSDCLREFDLAAALKTMTYEDFQMLRNALSWIALFQPTQGAWIDDYLDHFNVKDCAPFAIFEYEWLWISHLRRVKAAGAKLPREEMLEAHPLARARGLKIAALAEAWSKEIVAEAGDRSRATPGTLVVDDGTAQIRRGRTTLVSRPLVEVIKRLVAAQTMSFSEALWLGFGIAPYDAAIHAPKIHNLLARLKKLLPAGSTIVTKDQVIYWRGPAKSVRVIMPSPRAKSLFASGGEPSLASAGISVRRLFERAVHPRHLVEKAGGKRDLSRDEIQELMNTSKASTVRWLQKWQEQGLVKRRGIGRSIRYHIDIADKFRLTSVG